VAPFHGRRETLKPCRVVLFCGAVLDPGALRLLAAMRAHPDIEVAGAFAESPGLSWRHRIADLLRRRRWLAFPLLGAEAARFLARAAVNPVRFWRGCRASAALTSEFEVVADLHAAEVLQRIASLRPDLGVVYGGPVLRSDLFAIPRHGTLGIHHGKVPEYRGKKTTFWAMYNGEPTAGVTVQRLNERLDGGDVVLEGEVLAGRRKYAAVWRELEHLGIDLLMRAILDVAAGRATFRPQTGPAGRLYRDPALPDLLGFWWKRSRNRPCREIHG
jgi:folate-dependent phosphoribosylglycinamide formyltransferase PurN